MPVGLLSHDSAKDCLWITGLGKGPSLISSLMKQGLSSDILRMSEDEAAKAAASDTPLHDTLEEGCAHIESLVLPLDLSAQSESARARLQIRSH